MFQNLPYFWNTITKTHIIVFRPLFHLSISLLCDSMFSLKQKRLWVFVICISKIWQIFEAFLYSIKLNKNLLFLKSEQQELASGSDNKTNCDVILINCGTKRHEDLNFVKSKCLYVPKLIKMVSQLLLRSEDLAVYSSEIRDFYTI